MRHDLWRAILGAQGDLDRLVATAVGDYPERAPPRAAPVWPTAPRAGGPRLVSGGSAAAAAPRAMPAQDTARLWVEPRTPAATATATAAPAASVEQDTLRELHADVLARVEQLRAVLVREPGGEPAMLALVLYFDERIMGQLPDFLAPSWPLLQFPLTRRTTGGADFFRYIDRLRDGEHQPALVFEVYYFCLAAGFQGENADNPIALDRYRQLLRERIPTPEPARQPRELAPMASRAPVRWPALYYAAAGFLVLVVGFALTVWSNRGGG